MIRQFMENLFKENRCWAKAANWLAIASSLIYVFSRFVPDSALNHDLYSRYSPLDDSWIHTLHVAFAQHWQFGRDIIFTFGPWGFLSGGYYPPTFVTSAVAWAILSFVFWIGGWRLAHRFFVRPSIAWLWMMGFIGVAGLPVQQYIDVRLFAWVLILLALHFFVSDSPFSTAKILLVVSLSWLSLTKFTGIMMATAAVLAIAGDEVLRHRRFPWIIFIFAASLLFFWLAAGQQLSSLLPFFCNSWRITDGYTEAMMAGGGHELSAALIFLLVTLVVSMPIIYAGFSKYHCFGILPFLGAGFIVLVLFKHGFVRYDGQHKTVAALAVLLIALMSVAVSRLCLQSKGPKIVLMELLLLGVALVYSCSVFNSAIGKGFAQQFAKTFGLRSILSPGMLFYDTDDLRVTYTNCLAKIRKAYPVPELSGSVDVYPWNQDVVFAYGLDYRPRPIFQSYSAYTPKLAELNAAYLHGQHAPENILFAIDMVDTRFPSLDDGRSWPELLTRYDIERVTQNFVLLKRSATPRKYRLVPLEDVPIHFGERVELPVATNVPIWAEIKINKTLWGTMACTFYKPPALDLTVFLHGGRHFTYRLIPGMTQGGFLLSPLISDKASFVALALAGEENNLSNREVTSVTVVAATTSGSTICYKSPMQLCLYRLDFSRQNSEGLDFGRKLY